MLSFKAVCTKTLNICLYKKANYNIKMQKRLRINKDRSGLQLLQINNTG